MPKIRITQERSKIRCLEKHKRTLEALGLRRPNHSVIKEDTPQIRGMVAQVDYLVRVEPESDDSAPGRPRVSKPKPRGTKTAKSAAAKPRASKTKKAAS
jgi:large subunit ribosomal protein L30